VAAAANSYSQTPMYPAAFPEVIGVAATDWFGNLAGFSNFGPTVSLAAPGAKMFVAYPHAACGIDQSDPEGCYGWADGTSFSSPMVAGAAALVSSYIGPEATNAQVRAALEMGADTVGPLGQNMLAWTQYGSLNLLGALEASGGVTPPPPSATGLHVGNLDAVSINNGSTWTAEVAIEVHDENHGVVDIGTVFGRWSDGTVGSCDISAGSCQISANFAKKTSTVTFSVTSLIVGESEYVSGANHDAETDSDGTDITIVK
jgi:subtilisin family serine protease